MAKGLKINVKLNNRYFNEEKEVFVNVDIKEFAKAFLGIDYSDTENVKSIDLEIEEVEIKEFCLKEEN